MHKYLFLIFSIFIIGSCKKNDIKTNVQDYSISEEINLNDLVALGNQYFIVGGNRYTHSKLYSFSSNAELIELQKPLNATEKEIYSIAVSPNGNLMAVGFDAAIYTSLDSGQHWNFVQHSAWKTFQSVAFRDADSAFIVGGTGFAEGLLQRVNYLGLYNNLSLEEHNFEIASIHFVTPTIGYLSGYGSIMKTIDGGRSWNHTSAKNDFFKSMAWKNETEGIAVGFNGSIIKTSDAGNTWNMIRNGNQFLQKKYRLLDIAYHNSGFYVAVGEKGCMILSKDEGNTWEELNSFTKHDLRAVHFINQSKIIVVGSKGIIATIDF